MWYGAFILKYIDRLYIDDQDLRIIFGTIKIMAIPFFGIALMVSVGDFELDGTTYPKTTWLWITIAFLWGYVFRCVQGGNLFGRS